MRGRTIFNIALFSAFAAICIAGIFALAVNMGMTVPWSQDMQLKAVFDSTNGLVDQSEVRVSGVTVGTVLDIGATNSGKTVVTMAIKPGVPLRQDVRAVIRPKSLLGEKYVELVRSPGSSAALVQPGWTIPVSQTGQAIEIDDILNAMDASTRQAMSESFRQLGIALDSRATDLNNSFSPLDQTMANFRPIARVGEDRQKELDRILTNLNIIMQALADEQDALGRLVDSGDTAMSAIASRDQALAGTVQQGAALFGSLDQAFADLTPADRSSLAKSPGTIAAGRRLLSLTNPTVDQILPEILLGQLNYPNDQLNVTNSEAMVLASEWMSAFAETDPATGVHSLRISPAAPLPTGGSQPTGSAASPAAVNAPLTPAAGNDLYLFLVGKLPK